VSLVGAGPGDPDLLTLRAARLIMNARLIVHDGLVDPAVLAMARAGTRMVSVAKRRSRHTMPQAEINALLVAEALAGNDVVRLKGGDPFIFGRGGEEVEHLREAGIEVQVLNGITAGLAGLTSLGAPLTHRDHAHGVVFITGHAKPGDTGTDWQALAATARDAKLTLVIYMGVSSAEKIQADLLTGLPASTPLAIIQHVSLPQQRHALTTLGELPATIAREQLGSPAVIVVGDVVRGVAAMAQPEATLARHAA
jgi:uroporphyrin-III C-methyltransferase